jgi:hypothetical protein
MKYSKYRIMFDASVTKALFRGTTFKTNQMIADAGLDENSI